MKKITYIITVMLLSTVLALAAYAASPEITISSDSGKPGDIVYITLAIENNPGIVNISFDLYYDNSVFEPTAITDKALFGTAMYNADSLTSHPLRLTWSDLTAQNNFTGNGQLAVISFKIKDTAKAGEYTVYTAHSSSDIFDAYLSPVSFTDGGSVLTVEGNTTEDKTNLYISSTEGKPGEIVDVTISLNNNPGIVNLTFDLSYNKSAFELTAIKDGNLFGTSMYNANNLLVNPFRFTWADMTANTDFTGNGTLVTLSFKIKDGALPGAYGVTLNYGSGQIFNTGLNDVPLTVTNGVITVKETTATPSVLITVTKGAESVICDAAYSNIPEGSLVIAAGYLNNRPICIKTAKKDSENKKSFIMPKETDRITVYVFKSGSSLKPIIQEKTTAV